MYGKIFESMYDGSLYGQWEAIVTFQQMIVIADKFGVVDTTPQALAGKTSIPLEIIEKGIELLSKPDEMSRTPDEGGVRIVLLDDHRPWGWEIVNYAKYCEMAKYEDRRNQNRKNKRAQRERHQSAQETEQDAKAEGQDEVPSELKRGDQPKSNPKRKPNRFAEFWKAYPKECNEEGCKHIWVNRDLDAKADKIIADVEHRKANDRQWQQEDGRFIPNPERYLNESRWEDVTEVPKEQEPLVLMLLQCDYQTYAWFAPEVLAKVSDAERAEYEYIRARNLKNGHEEPDWNSAQNQAITKMLLEKLDSKSTKISTANWEKARAAFRN